MLVDIGENMGKPGSSTSSHVKDGVKKGGPAGSSSSQIEPPSLEAKTKFGSNLFRLTGVQLGHVLQLLDLRCPRALERPVNANDVMNNASNGNGGDGVSNIGGEEVEINVDAMDLRTFYELDSYVKERISKSRRKISTGNNSPSAGGNGQKEGISNNSQHGTSSLGDYSPSAFMSGSASASIDSDMDNGFSASVGGSKSSSSKKIGKRKR